MRDFQDRVAQPAADAPLRDLLGDPITRIVIRVAEKKLIIFNELSELVAVLCAGGMEREEIADAISCLERTLRTYFLPELNEGKSGKRAEVVEKLFEMAIGGNVPAMKASSHSA